MYHKTLSAALESEGLADAYATTPGLNIALYYEQSWRGHIGSKYVSVYRMPSGSYEIVSYNTTTR